MKNAYEAWHAFLRTTPIGALPRMGMRLMPPARRMHWPTKSASNQASSGFQELVRRSAYAL